jgi:hypothetical protein
MEHHWTDGRRNCRAWTHERLAGTNTEVKKMLEYARARWIMEVLRDPTTYVVYAGRFNLRREEKI